MGEPIIPIALTSKHITALVHWLRKFEPMPPELIAPYVALLNANQEERIVTPGSLWNDQNG